ncbi:MAG: ribonuclease P protein component [Bacillota bacterium]|nr:ribonuclease P protein component [Bacillota bacterium]
MPKSERLRKSRDFTRIFEHGKSLPGSRVVVYYLENGLSFNRVGIAVSRRLGGAVERNRLKRVVKEAYRASEAALRQGLDLVLLPRSKAKTASFQEVKDELLWILSECGALRKGDEEK